MAKRDSTTSSRPGRNSDPPASLEDIIEEERARLMVARSVLGCTKVALNNDDSEIEPLEYADVVEVAREMIEQTTVRLDSARLQRFYERIQPELSVVTMVPPSRLCGGIIRLTIHRQSEQWSQFHWHGLAW